MRTDEPEYQESSREQDSREQDSREQDSREQGLGEEKKYVCSRRDRIDEKTGKNGGNLEFITKVLEYRVGRKKMGKGRRKKKDKKKSP